jgi:hypothetical protein
VEPVFDRAPPPRPVGSAGQPFTSSEGVRRAELANKALYWAA